MPATREDYVHRVGRTARAGASGVGVTFVMHEQARELIGMVGELGLHRELELGGFPSDATRHPQPAGRPSGRSSGGSSGHPSGRSSRNRNSRRSPVRR